MPRQPGDPAKIEPHSPYRRIKIKMNLPAWLVHRLDALPLPRGREVERALIERHGFGVPREESDK